MSALFVPSSVEAGLFHWTSKNSDLWVALKESQGLTKVIRILSLGIVNGTKYHGIVEIF